MGQDAEGNLYRNGDKEFYYAQEGITTFTLKVEATSIYGKSSDSYAFRKCRSTLKTVNFPVGSMLEVINDNAFYCCSKIETIDLTNCLSLEKIGDGSFGACSSISTMLLPINLKMIGSYSVTGTHLTSISIPKSLTTFGRGAFAGNSHMQTIIFDKDTTLKELIDYVFERSGLVSFDLPPSLEKLTAFTLWENPSLKTITADNNKNYTIVNGCLLTKDEKTLVFCPPSYTTGTLELPKTIEKITKHAFHQCKAEEVILPESLLSVDNNIFQKAELKRITIPGNLTTLSFNMFYDSKLESITIPDTVTTLKEGVFSWCKNLKTIEIPTSITVYPKHLFENSGLTSITIPDGVTEIGESCFLGCTGLSEIFIPGSVTVLGGGSFSKCPDLNITFADDSPYTIDDQKLIISKDGTKIIQFIGEIPDTTINVAANVDTIREKSFFSNTNLVGIIFDPKNNIKFIEKSAFKECTNLVTFSFPKSVVEIHESAFYKTGLSSVNFGPKIEYIGSYCFKECQKLIDVTFDDSETLESQIVDREAFYNCKNLETIKFSNKLTKLGSHVISSTKIESIILPYTLTTVNEKCFASTKLKSVSFKKSATQNVISAFRSIPNRCFEFSQDLETFEFVDGIETIGLFAFQNTKLREVRLPPSLRNLKEECFSNCEFLEVLCSRDDEIALELFEIGVVLNCPNLREITFNNNNFVTKDAILFTKDLIDIVAYPPASPNEHISIPKEVEIIYPNVFYCCHNIRDAKFPYDSNLEQIGFHSFYNCSNLRIINIPQKVDLVGAEAFALCDSLQCGLVISNPGIIDSLINDGKMPKRCTKECVYTSKRNNKIIRDLIFIMICDFLAIA